MKCNNCLRDVTKISDVLDCRTCLTDGTANEIPKDMDVDAPLTAVLERKPGLAARFIAPPPPPPTKAEVKAAVKAEAVRVKAVAKAEAKAARLAKPRAKPKASKRRR